MQSNELLAPKEAAAKMRIHLDTLYQWLKMPSVPDGVVVRPNPRGRMFICWNKFEQWNPGRKGL